MLYPICVIVRIVLCCWTLPSLFVQPCHIFPAPHTCRSLSSEYMEKRSLDQPVFTSWTLEYEMHISFYVYPIKKGRLQPVFIYIGIKRLKVGCWLSSLCNFCYVLWSMTPYLYISISFHIFISHKKGKGAINATFSRSISNHFYLFRV